MHVNQTCPQYGVSASARKLHPSPVAQKGPSFLLKENFESRLPELRSRTRPQGRAGRSYLAVPEGRKINISNYAGGGIGFCVI
jgi:hypothetical protein